MSIELQYFMIWLSIIGIILIGGLLHFLIMSFVKLILKGFKVFKVLLTNRKIYKQYLLSHLQVVKMGLNKSQKEFIRIRKIQLKKDLKNSSKFTEEYHQSYLEGFTQLADQLKNLDD